jgi:hypothetical protein
MAATESITIRCEEDFKQRVTAFCDTQGRSVSDLLITAAERQMASSCEHCGRSDPPSGAAGLSEVAEAFFTSHEHGVLAPITITTMGRDRPIAYNAWRIPKVKTYGMLQLYVKHHRGTHGEVTTPFVLPRGVITGWDDDVDHEYYDHLVRHVGYRPGNDGVIRGAIRARRGQSTVTLTYRHVSDILCEEPGLVGAEYAERLGLFAGNLALTSGILILLDNRIIEERAGGRLYPRYQDPDDALEAIRRTRVGVDTGC